MLREPFMLALPVAEQEQHLAITGGQSRRIQTDFELARHSLDRAASTWDGTAPTAAQRSLMEGHLQDVEGYVQAIRVRAARLKERQEALSA